MADAYKTLVQAAIPTTAAQIGVAVPGGKSWIPGRWVVVNTNASGPLFFQLFKNGLVSPFHITGLFGLQAGGYATEDFLGAMAAAEFLAGVASGTGLVLMVEGDAARLGRR